MKNEWVDKKCWVAYFDALGFAKRANNNNKSFPLHHLKRTIDGFISLIEDKVAQANNIKNCDDIVDYLFFSDTFILYSTIEEAKGYPSVKLLVNF